MHRSPGHSRHLVAAAALGSMLACGTAWAEVLTFDSQAVGAFTGPVTEGSFAYDALSGDLVVRTLFRPSPPIMMSSVGGTGAGTLRIVRQDVAGGRFIFDGTDVMPYKDVNETAVFTGWLGGVLVATDVFKGVTELQFASRSAANLAGVEIDELRVALDVETPSGLIPEFIAVDNIALRSVAVVPEPSTWALMLAGVAGLSLGARRRRG
jgi:hypothetical protein